jgi:class 3 adenylate cyclase
MKQDCSISNQNIKIITAYLKHKVGHYETIFDGLDYPSSHYPSPEEFFLDENEWTSYDNYLEILRRGKELSGERYFYFQCGASTPYLRSFGRFNHFLLVFAKPDEGYKRLPFFVRNLSEVRQIEVVSGPKFDPRRRKVRAIIKIELTGKFDQNRDYIASTFTRGVISSIPLYWGLKQAMVKQPLQVFDPEILLNEEPEFAIYNLQAKMDGDQLFINDPESAKRIAVGRKVYLESEAINGKRLYLGRYVEPRKNNKLKDDSIEAVLITKTILSDGKVIVKSGEIFKAPYFILDVTYDKFSFRKRFFKSFRFQPNRDESERELIVTIDQLRGIVEEKNDAYLILEKTNEELKEAKEKVEEYNRTLERMVYLRTFELNKAKEELELFNKNLSAQVEEKVEALNRYNELRRYLSPKLTEKILSSGESWSPRPRRKLMTVLFSDIRNFSGLTESLEPEEIFNLMDHYLIEMTGIIHRHDGTLNKMIGDGLLVFLGDPLSMEDHAQKAVLMAIDMQKKVFELRDEWHHYGYDLAIGVGINTGYMTVGDIGSEVHRDYTVLGNQVNVAARLVSLAKPGQILISQRTYSKVKDLIEVEDMGEIQVKGIHQLIRTFNVVIPS